MNTSFHLRHLSLGVWLAALIASASGCPAEEVHWMCSGKDSSDCPGPDDEPCACTSRHAPVCGEDGKTYANACVASCAGVDIARRNTCKIARSCEDNSDCESSDVCDPPTGECRLACTIHCLRSEPVCGTDGVTYDCGREDAYCHGVDVAYNGACTQVSTCVYAGERFAAGDTFAMDCNTCTCSDNGSIRCTEIGCPDCDYEDPERTWVGQGAMECANMRFSCESGTRKFADECGCGCEPQDAQSGCKIGGCSGELCVSVGADDPVTSCEWRPEYACYERARCQSEGDGRCGWAETPELEACLANAR